MRTRLALVALVLLGCGPHAPETAPPTTLIASPSPTASATESASAIATTQADAHALLDAWTRAQNEAAFPAYDALYAARFEGIRRSGPRVRRFDRAGWIADRRPMFAHPMHVEVRDVAVALSAHGITLRFTQSFTEGTYHDEGPKEMTLVRELGILRIAREEMLASTIGPTGAATANTAGALMPVISAGATRWAVIASVPADADWDQGAPTLVVREAVVVTRASVRASAVPSALTALASQTVTLGDASGGGCTAHLGELAILSRVDVHFGVEQAWDGELPDGTHGPAATAAQVAYDAWGEGMLLVASLEDTGDCTNVTYARLASLPSDRAFGRSDAHAALAVHALAAFRALAGWTNLEAAFHAAGSSADGATPPSAAHWDETAGAAPAVSVWQSASSTRRFVVVGASTTTGGCADFAGALWAVFEVDASGALTPLTDASDPGYFAPMGALDVDGDGAPEWVVPEGIVGRIGTGLGTTLDISPAMHDCYC